MSLKWISLLCTVYGTHSTDKPSRRSRFRWGYGGRNRRLCSPREQAGAAPAGPAGPSRAGTPTVHKTHTFWLHLQAATTVIGRSNTHQKILSQSYFLWYFQVQASCYVTSLEHITSLLVVPLNIHINTDILALYNTFPVVMLHELACVRFTCSRSPESESSTHASIRMFW